MKKAGQPEFATEITAGRKTLLSAFANAVADKSAQSLAANWLRELYHHHGLTQRLLESYEFYRKLVRGEVTDSKGQEVVLTWIHDLLDGNLSGAEREAQASIMTINEQRAQAGLPPIANERQVGGDHYNKRPIQHWDFVVSQGYGYLEGQVTKYVFRWRDKNGVQDLEKAAHFLDKLIETATADFNPIDLMEFLNANDIPEEERSIYVALHAYQGTLDPSFLEYARAALARLVAKAR